LEELLDRYVPTLDRRCAVPTPRPWGVLLRSIIVEREPVYRQEETVHGFGPGLFGLGADEMEHLYDDRIGRALDRLFDAERAALLTEVVVAIGQRFGVKFILYLPKALHPCNSGSISAITIRRRSRSVASTGRPRAAQSGDARHGRSPMASIRITAPT
jgi:hypothetical protein